MGSLYALMGLALPPGTTGPAATDGSQPVSPALAMLSAANEAASVQVAALVQGLGAAPGTGSSDSLTAALMGLSTLDPTAELERLSGGVIGGA